MVFLHTPNGNTVLYFATYRTSRRDRIISNIYIYIWVTWARRYTHAFLFPGVQEEFGFFFLSLSLFSLAWPMPWMLTFSSDEVGLSE